MESHPIAKMFPMMNEDELAALAADIAAHGLHRPIILLNGMILDGRNRFEACKIARWAPRFIDFDGDDPYAFVWSENAERRHLGPDQKAAIKLMMDAERARWQEERQRVAEEANQRRRAAAEHAAKDNATSRFVEQTIVTGALSRDNAPVTNDGRTHLRFASELGISPATAARVQSLGNSRPDLLKKVAEGAMSAMQALRQKKHDEIATKMPDFPTGKYRVIYADPPWSYGNTQPDYQTEQRDHYPVMSIKDLCALPIKDLAETDAVLFLWVTSPILEEAFQVIKAWGFQYKASFVWDKIKHNMGHYNSVRHEFLLVCVRGSCQPDERKLFDSVQSIERTEHSVKPEEFRQIIETLYPHGRRIELFARRRVEGWETYGNEC
jgi:N6-adenosine-specific RNA methylase IME4